MVDNSRERRCQEWEASVLNAVNAVNITDSFPCLGDPDAAGQVRAKRETARTVSPDTPSECALK